MPVVVLFVLLAIVVAALTGLVALHSRQVRYETEQQIIHLARMENQRKD